VSEFDIAIDQGNDGKPEAFVVGVDLGAVTAGAFDGRFASVTFDAAGNLVDAWIATAPMNGSTALLPALASELGLDSQKGDTRFHYWVNAFSVVPGGLVDTTDAGSFDVYDQPVPTALGQTINATTKALVTPTLAPGQSQTFASMAVNRAALARNAVLGWLVITLDDANGAAQADEVPIGEAAPPGRGGSIPGHVEPPPVVPAEVGSSSR